MKGDLTERFNFYGWTKVHKPLIYTVRILDWDIMHIIMALIPSKRPFMKSLGFMHTFSSSPVNWDIVPFEVLKKGSKFMITKDFSSTIYLDHSLIHNPFLGTVCVPFINLTTN